ncbi:MAG: SUMF1/EgtB/PvdO family nonheme iron enzyme [Kiritimatiellae bacterium]|nr:SUMF1/EgtB/PvdO family nonheme iron enzyme [Kiritimatiellia bacterium]
MKRTLMILASGLALWHAAAAPVVSQVTVRQRWPWSRLVDIDYVLDGVDGGTWDIDVKAFDGTTPLVLPFASLSGDRVSVSNGAGRIVWDPTVTAYTNEQVLTQFSVELTPVQAPLYLIVDLTNAAGTPPAVQYVYEEEFAGGAYGTVETNPVVGITSLAWSGLTNDVAYKTDRLVLRRVRDFYIGVFEWTQGQRKSVSGAYYSGSHYTNEVDRAVHPDERLAYTTIRGGPDDDPAIDWPATGRAVKPSSLLGRLRTKSGLPFDLPTDEQWEFACRAGTATRFNNGSDDLSAMEELGWYKSNANDHTREAGLKRPNAWGLYDMHGNVEEWCLEWFDAERTLRVRRNGSWLREASYSASSYSTGYAPNGSGGTLGYRVVLNMR